MFPNNHKAFTSFLRRWWWLFVLVPCLHYHIPCLREATQSQQQNWILLAGRNLNRICSLFLQYTPGSNSMECKETVRYFSHLVEANPLWHLLKFWKSYEEKLSSMLLLARNRAVSVEEMKDATVNWMNRVSCQMRASLERIKKSCWLFPCDFLFCINYWSSRVRELETTGIG